MLLLKNVLGGVVVIWFAAESSSDRITGRISARVAYVGSVTPSVVNGVF